MKYLLAVAIVVATLASSAMAISCYNCDSSITPHCADPFNANEVPMANCSAPLMLALMNRTVVKECLKITPKSGNRVLRSCDYHDIPTNKSLCAKLNCHRCTGDFCNASTSMTPVTVAIVTLFGLCRLFS